MPDLFPSGSRMSAALRQKCLCLSKEEYKFYNICPANIAEEEEQQLVSDHVVLSNEKRSKQGIKPGVKLDCFALHHLIAGR